MSGHHGVALPVWIRLHVRTWYAFFIEQMKGDTVDSMAMAVEGAELMLIGVSQKYKESANCRMEAQYGRLLDKVCIYRRLYQRRSCANGSSFLTRDLCPIDDCRYAKA